MQLRIYGIRDTKGECFSAPFFKRTHGEAERDFQLLCQDEKSFPGKFPKDYDLYHIGEFDDQTGKIKALDAPVHLVSAITLVPDRLSEQGDHSRNVRLS